MSKKRVGNWNKFYKYQWKARQQLEACPPDLRTKSLLRQKPREGKTGLFKQNTWPTDSKSNVLEIGEGLR